MTGRSWIGGDRPVQEPGGARNVSFRQKGFERDEQAEIEVFSIHSLDNNMQKVRFPPRRRTE